MKTKATAFLVAGLMIGSIFVAPSFAGPPFVTDDPEPVDLHHFELYAFGTYNRFSDGKTATAPAVEFNYGALPDMQLHIVAPLVYDHPDGEDSHYGYGDTELGVKYRFFHGTDWLPEMAVFPLVELPTGDHNEGLGNGKVQVFLPLWLQKSWGEKDRQWTVYGGGGFWYNPGDDNRNFWRTGILLQKQVTDQLTLGGEIYHETAATRESDGHTAFNLGGIFDFNDHYHFLFSAGRDIDGPSRFATYLGIQMTF